MTREEHIKWCKERAIAELNYYPNLSDGIRNGITSMMSDLKKHPETNKDSLISLCAMILLEQQIRTRQEAINFINGFN